MYKHNYIVTKNVYLKKSIDKDKSDICEMYRNNKNYGLAYGDYNYVKQMIQLTIRRRYTNDFIGILKFYFPEKIYKSCWIQLLMLREIYRGKRLGNEIYNAFEAYLLEKHDIDNILLCTVKKNNEARYFWKKVGFKSCKKISITESKGMKSNILVIYNKKIV